MSKVISKMDNFLKTEVDSTQMAKVIDDVMFEYAQYKMLDIELPPVKEDAERLYFLKCLRDIFNTDEI